MSKVIQSLVWAFIIIAMAFASRLGWIEGDAARTMLIVLPLLAFLAITRSGGCSHQPKEA